MKTLYLGDRGPFVYYLQLALERAGYPIAIDGRFGTETYRALLNFLEIPELAAVNPAVWEKLMPFLRGYQMQIAENGRRIVTEIPFRLVPENVPYSSLLLQYILEGFEQRFPFLTVETAGYSVMGKPLSVIRMGNGSTQVFYNAAFHANEWITTPVLLKFVEEYAIAYARGGMLYGSLAEELFENYELVVMPMVNPDGVDLVTGVLTEGLYYEQAERISGEYPQIPFPSGWKANIEGIDLNLQFPAGWELAKEIKYAQGYTSPAPRDFVGTAPLTAPESAAVAELTVQSDFSLILAYHTQGQVIYWKYADYDPAGAAEIAAYFSAVSGYEVEETPAESGNAGYKDWFIMTYNRPGYTIEAGLGENPLPLSQLPEIYENNKLILLGGMTKSVEL